MIDNAYWDNKGVSADTAIETARAEWERMYRDNERSGRETPVVTVPRELGDIARSSVEATNDLTRRGNRRSFIVNIDLRALEAARLAELARVAAEEAAREVTATPAKVAQSSRARSASRPRREVKRHVERASR